MNKVHLAVPDEAPISVDYKPYDARRLSYSNTFSNPFKAGTIRALEWLTAKLYLLRRIREFEAMGAPRGHAFFLQVLKVMGVDVLTPPEQIAQIPKSGPVVVVANHPHGLVDGLVLAQLVGNVRQDYKILVRSLLTGVQEIDPFMISVPFPHEENAHRRSIDMRNEAMEHLKAGGVVILFPSGAVASSETMFGEVVEQPWNPFTAKLILKSGASVVPIYFPGRNSRSYQIANRISATIRQGLLLREIKKSMFRPQKPVIGAPISSEEAMQWKGNPRGFMAWLRERTLSLAEK
ncbi:lysophospholipid acyltransferase family protein [Celeribacter sp.]|uniref:lysophospholipid acyltransferase family protein n=1 Tax=Celeribacter sp. TaxID=1890673 RepID=UPI003A9592D3